MLLFILSYDKIKLYTSEVFCMVVSKNKGFTLVEVIMVVVVLGIIIGIAVPSYIAVSNNIRSKNYENDILWG